MYLVRSAIILLLAVSIRAALVNNGFVGHELELYRARVDVIYQQLRKECPDVQLRKSIQRRDIISKEKLLLTELETEKTLYANIINKLTECREAKFAATKSTTSSSSTSTPATVSVTPTSTPPLVTSTPSTHIPTTTPQLNCQNQQGYLKTSIDFVNYRNPSGNKATGVGCDEEDKTQCDIYFEICISHIDMRDCRLYNDTTEIIGEGLSLLFSADLGGVPNPLILDLEDQKWAGVNILVKVWDRDEGKPSDDLVDEFTYDFTDPPGSNSRSVDLESVRKEPKSWLQLTIRNFCPSETTTTATTTTTITTTTTTQTPPPADCVSAINLTESWRKDNTGSKIEPINGAVNCDSKAMVERGRPWFRFSGAAGNRLLDSCPPYSSCGTHVGLWSKDVMPTDIGVTKNIMSYWSHGLGSSSCKSAYRMSVMRCSSSPHDFIYRYDDSNTVCSVGFCGMS